MFRPLRSLYSLRTYASLALCALAVACNSGVYALPYDASADVASTADAPSEASDVDGATSDAGKGPDAGKEPDAACLSAAPPPVGAYSLRLQAVDFADGDPSSLGFDMDDRCTTLQSSNVCALYSGASQLNQVDGNGGRDNAWGTRVVGLIAGAFSISDVTKAVNGYPSLLQVDASGAGKLVFQLDDPIKQVPIPIVLGIRATRVVNNGSVGVIGAVLDVDELIETLRDVLGTVQPSACQSSQFSALALQLRRSADIFADGTNGPYGTCNGISLALKFSGATSGAGPMPTRLNGCAP